MGNFQSYESNVSTELREDLDGTRVNIKQCHSALHDSFYHQLNPHTLGVQKAIPKAHDQYVRVLTYDCINHSPGQLLSGGGDGVIGIWNSETFEKIGQISISKESSVRSLLVTPGCWLSGHSDGEVIISDPHKHHEIARLEAHEEAVYALLYIPTISVIVTGAERLCIWKKQIRSFQYLESIDQEVICICATTQWFFTGQMNNDVGVWAIPFDGYSWGIEDEGCNVLQGHTRSVWSVESIESKHIILSGSADATMRIWQIGTWECLRICTFNGWVVDLHFGGQKLLSASNDGSVKIWNTDTFAVEKTLHLDGEIYAVMVFDGGKIACAGEKKSIIIYREANENVKNLDKTFAPKKRMMDDDDCTMNNQNIDDTDSGFQPKNMNLEDTCVFEQRIKKWDQMPAISSSNPFEFSMAEFQVVPVDELAQMDFTISQTRKSIENTQMSTPGNDDLKSTLEETKIPGRAPFNFGPTPIPEIPSFTLEATQIPPELPSFNMEATKIPESIQTKYSSYENDNLKNNRASFEHSSGFPTPPASLLLPVADINESFKNAMQFPEIPIISAQTQEKIEESVRSSQVEDDLLETRRPTILTFPTIEHTPIHRSPRPPPKDTIDDGTPTLRPPVQIERWDDDEPYSSYHEPNIPPAFCKNTTSGRTSGNELNDSALYPPMDYSHLPSFPSIPKQTDEPLSSRSKDAITRLLSVASMPDEMEDHVSGLQQGLRQSKEFEKSIYCPEIKNSGLNQTYSNPFDFTQSQFQVVTAPDRPDLSSDDEDEPECKNV